MSALPELGITECRIVEFEPKNILQKHYETHRLKPSK